MNKIHFAKATLQDKDTIFRWLVEPHVQEFWDNSQAHKDDIVNFMHGRKEPSDYAGGQFIYWIGFIDNTPFCLVMTIKENFGEEREEIKNNHLSTTGSTYSIDYMIGEKQYFGKGLGATTLQTFTEFFQDQIDNNADTFFIDPDVTNSRAKYVYEKAGFLYVGDFMMNGTGVFRGHQTHFMVKKMPLTHKKSAENECKLDFMEKHFENHLHELIALDKDTRKFGFQWPNETIILDQVIDECREIKEAIDNGEDITRIQEEIGDLIHSAVSLCIFKGFDVDETLQKINSKFRRRMQEVKKLTHELELTNLHGQRFEFMLEVWRKAKENINSK